MTFTASYLGIAGLALTFLPQEIAGFLDIGSNKMAILSLQILGALYFGFAMINWMTKGNLLGGIYGRPLIIGNLTHFFISSFALIKLLGNDPGTNFSLLLVLAIIYGILTLCFGYLFMFNPPSIQAGNHEN